MLQRSNGLQCANTEEKNFAPIPNMMIRFFNLPIWNEKDVEMVTKWKSHSVCNHYEDVWAAYFGENVNETKQ